MNIFQQLGRYWLFMASLFPKPEKWRIYLRRVVEELDSIGVSSIGIVSLISIFMGAVITIQSAYNLINPFVPMWVVGLVRAIPSS